MASLRCVCVKRSEQVTRAFFSFFFILIRTTCYVRPGSSPPITAEEEEATRHESRQATHRLGTDIKEEDDDDDTDVCVGTFTSSAVVVIDV